jgi:hypothetical protein
VRRVDEVRAWLAVVATLSAVFLALYLNLIRERLQRPRLTLDFEPSPAHDAPLDLITHPEPAPAHWIRLRVSNAPGRRSAEDVQVLVTRIQPRASPGLGKLPLDTRPLRWTGLYDESSNTAITEIALPPGLARHIDLLALREPDGEGIKEGRQASALVQVWPSTQGPRSWISAGTYDLELAVVARDTNTRRYRAEIEFDGVWRAGPEIWDHLRFRGLSEV